MSTAYARASALVDPDHKPKRSRFDLDAEMEKVASVEFGEMPGEDKHASALNSDISKTVEILGWGSDGKGADDVVGPAQDPSASGECEVQVRRYRYLLKRTKR